jgi:hypothetical protein
VSLALTYPEILSIKSLKYDGSTLLYKVTPLPFLSLYLTLFSSFSSLLFLLTIVNILSSFSHAAPSFAVEAA